MKIILLSTIVLSVVAGTAYGLVAVRENMVDVNLANKHYNVPKFWFSGMDCGSCHDG